MKLLMPPICSMKCLAENSLLKDGFVAFVRLKEIGQVSELGLLQQFFCFPFWFANILFSDVNKIVLCHLCHV